MNNHSAAFEKDDPITSSNERVSRLQFLRLSNWFSLALCLVAMVLPLLLGRTPVWSDLGLTGLFSRWTAFGGFLGLIVGAIVAMLIIHWRPLQVIAERLAHLVAWDTLQMTDYFVVALMAALGEELVFRGALQPLIGLIPMAVVFGLLHATCVAHVILAGLLGLLLGLMYTWSGSLWPPIAGHFAIDLISGLLLSRSVHPRALPHQGV